MRFNKLKLYDATGNAGGSVLDELYNEATWNNDASHAPSRNAIRDKLESMGLIGHIIVVDDAYGNDYTARADNILKPFKTHQAAIFAVSPGVPTIMVTMPGTYSIDSIFGFPLRDRLDHILLNATINLTSVFSYGSLLTYPVVVTCSIKGKGTINNLATNSEWCMIVPYNGCDIELDGITFTGNRNIFGQLGGFYSQKNLRIKNCKFYSTFNGFDIAVNAGNLNATSDTYVDIRDSYIKGSIFLSTMNGIQADEFIFRAERCYFEGLNGDPANINASLALIDYGDSDTAKVMIKDSVFKSQRECLYAGVGGSPSTNKTLVVDNCRFVCGPQGWLKSENSSLIYKLLYNVATTIESGTYPVLNSLSGSGVNIEPALEVF